MNVTKRSHDKYYGRVMPRVYRQSDSSIKPNSLVVRHEIPSVRVGAKPSVSKSSGVFSELPTILNDYVPDLGNGKIKKRSFVAKPRRTIKSLDPAKSPPQRTVKNVSEFGERFNITNVRAHDSDPIVINRIKDNWSNTHLRQCYSSRSHTKLKELKDEIKAYHDTEKNLKFRNNLYKSCGLVLNDGQRVAVDKAVQSESVKTDNDGSEISFPNEPVRKETWSRIIRLQRKDPYFKPFKNTRLCSAHFCENDVDISKAGKRRLKESAIPRIEVCVNEEPQPITPSNTSQAEEMDVDISDLNSIFDTPRELQMKKTIKRLKLRQQISSKKIKNLQRQNTRLKKKNQSLLAFIKELSQKTADIEAALGINVESVRENTIQ